MPNRHFRRENPNVRELRGYYDVKKRLPPHSRYLSDVYGLIDTNFGEGLEVENINPSGRPMFNLKKFKKHGKDGLPDQIHIEGILLQIDQMCSDIRNIRLNNHCFSLESIVFVERECGYMMHLIDYKTPSFAPLSVNYWFCHFYKTKMLKNVRSKLEKCFTQTNGKYR